jgi:ubiquitin C-terminal hydrolase
MNSLQETLHHMIEGETINDYFCEKCQKKYDTTKRVLLNDLPNVLIIHL